MVRASARARRRRRRQRRRGGGARALPPLPLTRAGEFVGGCDIATQLNQSGELGKLLAAGAPKAAA